MNKRSAHLTMTGLFLMSTLLFQNCQSFQVSDPGTSALQTPEPPAIEETVIETGRFGSYVVLDETGTCGTNPNAIKSKIEVRDDGVYRLIQNCVSLTTPVRLPVASIYFAELSEVALIDGELFVSEGKEHSGDVLRKTAEDHRFCTNRWTTTASKSLEVRLDKRSDVADTFRAKVFVSDAVGSSQANFVKVTASPGSYELERKATGAEMKMTISSPDKSTNKVHFRLDAVSAPVDLDGVRCWSVSMAGNE